MKFKISLFSLFAAAVFLTAFILKESNDKKENELGKYEIFENEEKENFENKEKDAELENKRFVNISPEKQNEIWSNLDNYHKNKRSQEDAQLIPWSMYGPAGIRNMYSSDVLQKYTGRCMMVDFDRNGNYWIASAHGGLWAGPFLTVPIPYSENLNTQKIGAFATHPAHDSDFFVGTGLYRPGNDDGGTGLWRTRNNAATFQQQNLPGQTPYWFNSIKFHRTNPNIILAASSEGLFRTSNDGSSWDKIIVGDTTIENFQRISDLQLDPSNPDIMYAVREGSIRRGFYKSTNAGLNWNLIYQPATTIRNSRITVCKNFPNILFANIVDLTNKTFGIAKSTNSGANWSLDTNARAILGNQGFNNCAIGVCPNDPNTVIAGGVFMARSTNGGTEWTQVDDNYMHPDVTSIAWKSNTEVWCTCDGGVFKSTDKGATWFTPDNVMACSEIFYIAISPSFELDQAIGLEHNGVCISHLGGDNYKMTLGGDGSGVAFHPFNTNKVYCSVGVFPTGGLPFRWFKSTSGGDYTTWSDISSNISNPCGQWYQCIRTDKQSPVNLYTNVCKTVWMSTNDGSSWNDLNCPTGPYFINRMITVSDNGTVFACPNDTGGVNTGKLKVYSGGTWSDRTPNGVGKNQIERVRFSPRNPNIAFAITSGTNSVGNKIFRSTNLGLNWVNITGAGLDDVPMADVVAHPTDPNKIYVGTQGFGFFGTTDGGNHWYKWDNGAPKAVRVTEMTYIDSGFVSDHFIIFAATFGRGIYIRDLSEDPSVIGNNGAIVNDYYLKQNYPNPFNPLTTIEFNMKKGGGVKLQVFDITGKLIATLIDEYRRAGKQITKFSGYDLSSGVYFYRLATEDFIDTKKMMVVK
ncbi:MAG: T9SS type A sorting domain-containing protein [Ignavibacteria bacterium]|nr:T9SS type A sorting domain-containing protein [Ignavibacteria bacterium]